MNLKHPSIVASIVVGALLPLGCGEVDDVLTASQAVQTTVSWSSWKTTIGFTPGKHVVVPANLRVLFDEVDPALQIGKLTVDGTFECGSGDRTLNVEGVLVRGASGLFKCGSATAPRSERFTIQLRGHSTFSMADASVGTCMAHSSNFGEQSFVVTCGGRLELFGATPTNVWTRLAANVAADPAGKTASLTVTPNSAAGWKAGDLVAVAGTRFSGAESEVRTLKSGSTATTLLLDGKLTYPHLGTSETHTRAATAALPAKSWTLREQAEVANLTRTIVVKGTADGNKGGHIMIMASPGIAKISGVELNTMGRMGEMGRYPIHWHMIGDGGAGHFIEKSVIRNSFNRCVTVHETNNVRLSNNVCYDHYGHGFFLETGNEELNTFENNVVFRSKKVPAGSEILSTDVRTDNPSRYEAPASFWISNPNNTFTGNVAAGGDGTGFWFALKDAAHLAMTPSARQTDMLKFEDNVAHSVRHGFSLDGGPNGACADGDANTAGIQDNPRNTGCVATNGMSGDVLTTGTNYDPPTPALNTLRRITAYKCREYGIWNRSRNGYIQDSVFADNLIHAGLVFSIELANSVLIAKSGSWDGALEGTKYTADRTPTGLVVYDGPFSVSNTQFDGYDKGMSYQGASVTPKLFRLTVAASNRGTTNRTKGITFGAPPALIADMEHDLGHYSKDNWAAGLWDQDGSLTGRANYTVVPDEPIVKHADCLTDPKIANGILCPGRFGLVFINRGEAKFDVTRTEPSGATASFLLPEDTGTCDAKSDSGFCAVNHQFSFPFGHNDDTYEVRLHEDAIVSGTATASLYWAAQGEKSPKVTLYKMGESCGLVGTPVGVTSFTPPPGAVSVQWTGDHALMTDADGSGTETPSTYGWSQNYGSSISFKCVVPTRMEFESPAVAKTGGWYFEGNGSMLVGWKTGSTFEAHVTGSNLRVLASAGPNRGKAQIVVDGGAPFDVDLYQATYGQKTFVLPTAGAGEHGVKVVQTGAKNAASSGTYVVLDAVESF